jgi:hypothetical protein
MAFDLSPVIRDMLAERRERRISTQYQAKHGAGVETQEQMEVAAAKQRHPSYAAKHRKP